MAAKLSDDERDFAAQIVALFSVLVHSWMTNNFSEAARVKDKLLQHGVRVQLPRRPARQTTAPSTQPGDSR